MQISEHFTLAELTKTSQPFDNTPGPPEVANLRTLARFVLEPVRARFGPVRVNSAFRSSLVNRAVGSRDTSQHRRGEAADIEVEGLANADLARWIVEHVAFDQVILEAYRPGVPGSGWVHVSYRAGRLRHKVDTMVMGTHGPVYHPGLRV